MNAITIISRKHVHITGIKGVGNTALALCLQDLGIHVTGSDVPEEFVTDKILKKRNIVCKIGFSPDNIEPTTDLVVTTGAHGGLNNPEVIAARNSGITVTTYSEALADLTNSKNLVAVSGMGGKTTTSSMLAVMLNYVQFNPSFVVGVGEIFPDTYPGQFTKNGDWFIAEADDYVVSPGIDNRPKFELLDPKIIILTNLEHDHPDIYPTFDDTVKVFKKYLSKTSDDGMVIGCVDNPNVKNLFSELHIPITTYGFSKDADFQISNLKIINGISYFSIKHQDTIYNLQLKVPGEHNIKNATAAFATGIFLKLKSDKLIEGLKSYEGCKRRFEKREEYRGALLIDDYAHHPKEVESVLKATQTWYPDRRIFAVFQPHTYSRTKALLSDFSKAFNDAHAVAIMDIYASAREQIDPSISSKILVDQIKKHNKNVVLTENEEKTLVWIRENIQENDILLTIGAGDVYKILDKLN